MTLAPVSVLLVASLLFARPALSPTLSAPMPASQLSVVPLSGHPVDLRRALHLSSTYRGAPSVASLPTQAVTSAHRRPAVLSLLGVAAGFVGGAFAGGMIGARVEPPCGCDDPGLKGFVYGAWIGGAVGAITAGYFLNK